MPLGFVVSKREGPPAKTPELYIIANLSMRLKAMAENAL